MIVKNPTAHDIAVQIEGRKYFVPANGETSGVRPEDAAHWKVRLHTFIELAEEAGFVPAVAPVAPVASVASVEPTADAEPLFYGEHSVVGEEVIEEVVEEEPEIPMEKVIVKGKK